MEVEECPLPEDRLYDLENDVWLYRERGSDRATLGVLASLAAFAGRFTSVGYRPEGGELARGRSVATIESVRFTGAVRLPVAARVLERNPALPDRPRLLNDAPYGAGWVVQIGLADPESSVASLQSAAAVRAGLAEKIRAMHIRCLPATPDSELYEIGAECAAVLAQLDEEIARRAPGEVVLLVTDDPTAPIEMVRWTDRTGHAILSHRREENLHHFLVRREVDPRPRLRRRVG
jgi:glycine cleavage system H protein